MHCSSPPWSPGLIWRNSYYEGVGSHIRCWFSGGCWLFLDGAEIFYLFLRVLPAVGVSWSIFASLPSKGRAPFSLGCSVVWFLWSQWDTYEGSQTRRLVKGVSWGLYFQWKAALGSTQIDLLCSHPWESGCALGVNGSGFRAGDLPLMTGADSATSHLISVGLLPGCVSTDGVGWISGPYFRGPFWFLAIALFIHWGTGKTFLSVLL